MSMVDAEFQLPTPFAQRRKFRFLRSLRRVREEMWIIVDVSIDYFPQASDFITDQNSKRRPSGMIIRRREYYSEVLWVENVEVPECQTQDSIYTGIINTNMAFCAKVWVSTLIWGLKRNYRRRLVNTKIPMTNEVHTRMRKLSESMKMVYLDIVRGSPDVTRWIRISNRDVRVMIYALENPDHKLGLINYVAVTSFRVQAEPLSVFNFLVKKSQGLQGHASPNQREPEEVIKAVSGIDDSYCISLYDMGDGFMIQEASRNGFCSFIISTPLNLPDINSSVYDGQVLLLPSGFAIMADESDASLVTIAVQQKIDVDESAQVIESMENLITSTIKKICEEISKDAEHLAGSMEKLDLKK